MLKIDLLNLIPVFARKENPEPIQGEEPQEASEAIRKSCSDQAGSYEKWSHLIRKNCPIPPDHPYKTILESRGIPSTDPLWTLGSIAFGTETPWIVFMAIHWPDKTDYPEQLDMEWTKTQASKAGL